MLSSCSRPATEPACCTTSSTTRPPGLGGAPARLRLEPLTDFEALAREWDDLARAADSVFATREWLGAWWRHRPADAVLHAAACRSAEGRLVGIIPLYASKERGLHTLRFVGDGPSDQLGPVCAPEDRASVARAMREFLDDLPRRWDVLIANHLPGDQRWDDLLDGIVLHRTANLVVRFDGASWEDFIGSLGARLRQEVRYDARRLEREHGVRYRLVEDPRQLDEDLDVLFELHRSRWDARTGFTQWEAMHRDFSAMALARGWLRFWVLELDGRPAAAKYNFRFGGAEYSYQSGRDPSFRRTSLGLIMLAHAMRDALDSGVREYRFLRGSEPHKRRFPAEARDLETIALARGPLRAAALSVAHDLRGMRSAARRRWSDRPRFAAG